MAWPHREPSADSITDLSDDDAVAAVGWLVDHGADIEGRGINLGTALCTAALWGRRQVVELLLARGAQPLAYDVDRATPRDLALMKGRADVAALLGG